MIGLKNTVALVLTVAGCGGGSAGGAMTSAPRTTGAAPSSSTITTAPPPPAAPRADASLIPRKVLFGNPERTSPTVSSDGKWIAFLAPVDGVLNVMVAPYDELAKAKPATHDKTRPILRFWWAETPGTLIYAQDAAGDENWHLYATSLASGEVKDLTPYQGVAAQLLAISPRRPSEILIGMNDRDARWHDVYRVDLKTAARTLVQKNEGFAGFISDDDYRARAGVKTMQDGSMAIILPGAKGSFDETLMTVPFEDAFSSHPIGFDAEGKTLYLIDSRDRDTAALFALDMATKKTKLLAEDPKADVLGVWAHPTTHKPIVAFSELDRRRHIVLDATFNADEEYLKSIAPDADVDVSSCSRDLTRCIVRVVVSDGPLRFYAFERKAKKATFLFSHRPALEKLTLARMTTESIPSRDGMNLVSYLSLPPGSDPDKDGRPSSPLPMVLLVHGGPWSRNSWGYDRNHQWLANRGYAVLSVNFRGSTGLGKKFINAGNKEWAGTMHADLIDAVDWAVKNGVADAHKVAIYGGSYGGYSALVGVTFTPDAFACAVDMFGPVNLVTLGQTIPPYWAPFIEQFARRVGDFRTDDGKQLLMSRSPLSRASAIKKPLLIGQGANDVRVKQNESDQIVSAMKSKGLPVTYLRFSDEGHGWVRPENEIAFDAVAETFLAQCLGGSYQPVERDFEGSSIAVPAGAESVYGLSDALKNAPKQ